MSLGTNAIGGINLNLIAQDSLSTLLAEFPRSLSSLRTSAVKSLPVAKPLLPASLLQSRQSLTLVLTATKSLMLSLWNAKSPSTSIKAS